MHYGLWGQINKSVPMSMVHSIQPKSYKYIKSYNLTYCIDFGEFRFHSFITEEQKRNFVHNGL